jgi:hypothetical protein
MAKFNVKFSESVYRLLAGVALDRGQTMADVLRDEVARGAWLDDQLRQGHHMLIDRGKGKIVELTFAHESLLNPAGRPMPLHVTREAELNPENIGNDADAAGPAVTDGLQRPSRMIDRSWIANDGGGGKAVGTELAA